MRWNFLLISYADFGVKFHIIMQEGCVN